LSISKSIIEPSQIQEITEISSKKSEEEKLESDPDSDLEDEPYSFSVLDILKKK